MNRAQVAEWVEYHTAIFDYWGQMLEGLDDAGRAIQMDGIALALGPFTLDSAKEASRGIQSGRIPRPFYTEDHVGAVANDCRERAAADRKEYREPYHGVKQLADATPQERADARSILAECKAACAEAWTDHLAAGGKDWRV